MFALDLEKPKVWTLSNRLPGMTERAARAIEFLAQKYAAHETEEVCMPVVGWLDDLSVTGYSRTMPGFLFLPKRYHLHLSSSSTA
jgi:hypothetical protein